MTMWRIENWNWKTMILVQFKSMRIFESKVIWSLIYSKNVMISNALNGFYNVKMDNRLYALTVFFELSEPLGAQSQKVDLNILDTKLSEFLEFLIKENDWFSYKTKLTNSALVFDHFFFRLRTSIKFPNRNVICLSTGYQKKS